MSQKYPLFVKRDLDGFFGLFIDNIVQLLAILYLCRENCGMIGEQAELITAYILPGAAVSIILGNVFYAWQAHRLAAKSGRSDVCALPYGINTPSMLIFIYFVILPAYGQTGDARFAWMMGLIACLGSGLIEFFGAFIAEWIRKHTPRAALLSTLAGIAIGFISMTFALQIFQKPLVALPPLALVFVSLFARSRFPLNFPGGFVAVLCGTAVAWGMTGLQQIWPEVPGWLTTGAMDYKQLRETTQATQSQWSESGLYLPIFVGAELWSALQNWKDWLGYLTVIIPMGIFNVIGSLQNIESSEAAGDAYGTTSSLAVNGLGTILAALFGSCFPTTIYIGHPGWKEMGSRAGYSTLNGIVITILCLTGLVPVISALVPIEAGVAIVLWIGIIITAQAFQTTPSEHAPAVACGLFPAIAAWGSTVVRGAIRVSDGSLQKLLTDNPAQEVNGFLLHSLLVLEQGYIFTCMILAAIAAHLVDRKFYAATIWSLVGCFCAVVGLTHSYQIFFDNVFDYLFIHTRFIDQAAFEGRTLYYADGIAAGYFLMAVLFLWFAGSAKRGSESDSSG